ncbi:hypothetical protein QQZ08_003932 [Neonectria magnoliae]|uniref:Uncharacterized protein n=1 Tax=Neonectria magnoliae TaxID=2732573 RepID=A0ABR1I7J7_9HYPO
MLYELSGMVHFHIMFQPNNSFDDYWAPKLANFIQLVSPYAQFIEKVRDNVTDLTFGNFVMDDIQPPEHPIPAANIFASNTQRTYAQEMVDVKLNAVIIRDLFSVWEPQEKDVVTYGIAADRVPLHQYLMISCKDIADLLPDIGDLCTFYFPVDYPRRPAPDCPKAYSEDVDMLDELTDNIEKAYDDSSINCFVNETDNLAALELESKRNFIAGVLEAVFPMIQSPDDAVVAEYPQEDMEFHRAVSAISWVMDIVAAFDNPLTFGEYLTKWVIDHASCQTEQSVDENGEAWRARRIPLPPGTRANVALFSVRTPSQQNWPVNLSRPPVAPKFPAVSIMGPVPRFLRDLGGELDSEDQRLKTVPVRLWYVLNEETIKIEGQAVTAMNALPKASRAQAFWDYTLDFQKTQKPSNFHQRYPQLQADLDAGLFRGEHATVIANLKDAGGYAFIHGGPGSGKSTFGMTISHSLMKSRRKSSEIPHLMPSFRTLAIN